MLLSNEDIQSSLSLTTKINIYTIQIIKAKRPENPPNKIKIPQIHIAILSLLRTMVVRALAVARAVHLERVDALLQRVTRGKTHHVPAFCAAVVLQPSARA